MQTHDFWHQQCVLLDRETDLNNFKNWLPVRNIPLYSDSEYVANFIAENKAMIKVSSCPDRWNTIFAKGEPTRGHNAVSVKRAGPFRLKSLHHCLSFEEMRGRLLTDYKAIVEFGAGIGDTAYTILDSGFQGSYHIIDLPSVSRISRFYLQDFKNVFFHEKLENICLSVKSSDILFIATWSLSEIPLTYRNEIATRIQGWDYMILFQKTFKEINNTAYFIGGAWAYLSNSYYRIRQLTFHDADAGSVYMIGRSV